MGYLFSHVGLDSVKLYSAVLLSRESWKCKLLFMNLRKLHISPISLLTSMLYVTLCLVSPSFKLIWHISFPIPISKFLEVEVLWLTIPIF